MCQHILRPPDVVRSDHTSLFSSFRTTARHRREVWSNQTTLLAGHFLVKKKLSFLYSQNCSDFWSEGPHSGQKAHFSRLSKLRKFCMFILAVYLWEVPNAPVASSST